MHLVICKHMCMCVCVHTQVCVCLNPNSMKKGRKNKRQGNKERNAPSSFPVFTGNKPLDRETHR